MSLGALSIGSLLSSSRLTVVLIAILVALSIVGACVPQLDQSEPSLLSAWAIRTSSPLFSFLGLSDVFHSWPFVTCVVGLFVNLIACTILRMPARIRSRLNNDDFFEAAQILSFRGAISIEMPYGLRGALEYLNRHMGALGYRMYVNGNRVIFQKGELAWLAAPVTHLGLFVLLLGSLISILFSYSGTVYLTEGQKEPLAHFVTHKGPLARPSPVSMKLLSTEKQVHENGAPKQWLSTVSISVAGKKDRVGTSSVNHPLSVDNIDFYQSDWQVAAAIIGIKNRNLKVLFQDAGHGKMATVHLPGDLLLIFALQKANSDINVFLNGPGLKRPRFLACLSEGQSVRNFPVPVCYLSTLPQSGIKFKSDPGQVVLFSSFLLLFLGSIFVSMPNLRIWASVDAAGKDCVKCTLGFQSVKSASLVRADLRRLERDVSLQPGFKRGVTAGEC